MKNLFWILSLLVMINSVAAHDGHDRDETMPMQVIKEIAAEVAIKLTQEDADLGFGKLPASWQKISKQEITLHEEGGDYYIVKVYNRSAKTSLYVLMDLLGDVYDVNLTGKFDGLE